MTVKDLRKFLSAFPGEMEVLESRYSDLGPMSLDSWSTIDGTEKVSGRHGWVQRPNAMTDANRAKIKRYVFFAGN